MTSYQYNWRIIDLKHFNKDTDLNIVMSRIFKMHPIKIVLFELAMWFLYNLSENQKFHLIRNAKFSFKTAIANEIRWEIQNNTKQMK